MLIYASSSRDYFLEHGEAFICSAKRHGHDVLIDMTDDFPAFRGMFDNERIFSLFLRYLRLPDLLDRDVLMLDVDSIINKQIEKIDCDIALFFRPWIESERKRVLMTASYWTPSARPFAETVRNQIKVRNNQWFDDQLIVWKTYQEIGGQFDVAKLDEDFVCYHFDRDAPIWTCKGPSRKGHPVYLQRRRAYEAAA